MIKENQRIFNAVQVLADVLVVLLALGLAWNIRFKTTLFGPIGGHLSIQAYTLFAIFVVVPVYLILFYFFGLYKPFRNQSSIFSEATDIAKVNIMAFILLVAFLFIIDEPDFSRIMLFLLALFGMILCTIERSLIRSILRLIRANDHNLKHILVVGDNDLAYTFIRKIKSKKYLGYSVRGILGRKKHLGYEIEVCTSYVDGGEGAINLSKKIIDICNNEIDYKPLYSFDDTIINKINKISKEIYRAKKGIISDKIKEKIEFYEKNSFGKLPICIAKTQYSFTSDPKLLGAPNDFNMEIKDIKISNGAGFIVVLMGNIMTMPGLGKNSAYLNMNIDNDGVIKGLF